MLSLYPLDISVALGAFVLGLSQISSFSLVLFLICRLFNVITSISMFSNEIKVKMTDANTPKQSEGVILPFRYCCRTFIKAGDINIRLCV